VTANRDFCAERGVERLELLSMHKIEIVEKLVRIIEVDTENSNDAIHQAQRFWKDSRIVLDYNDLDSVDFRLRTYDVCDCSGARGHLIGTAYS
jgi:hypothetical protein